MEYTVANYDNELYHHGIKGMKWGVRRYQNKDGTLTDAGRKRYNDAIGTLNDPNKGSFSKKRAQKTVDKLSGAKKKTDEKEQETLEERRQRILNSTNAKEIYENRNLLTTNELNERINRIDKEASLKSKIVEEHVETGMDRVNSSLKNASNTIDNASNLFKSVDQAYSSVANSAIGKTLAKQLGIEPPKKKFDINEFWKNRHSKTAKEMQEANKWLTAEANIKKNMDARNADSRKAEAQKQVDDYNKRWQERKTEPEVTPGGYAKKGSELDNSRDYTWEVNNPPAIIRDATTSLSRSTISSSSTKTKADRGKSYAEDVLDRDGNVIVTLDENGNPIIDRTGLRKR